MICSLRNFQCSKCIYFFLSQFSRFTGTPLKRGNLDQNFSLRICLNLLIHYVSIWICDLLLYSHVVAKCGVGDSRRRYCSTVKALFVLPLSHFSGDSSLLFCRSMRQRPTVELCVLIMPVMSTKLPVRLG